MNNTSQPTEKQNNDGNFNLGNIEINQMLDNKTVSVEFHLPIRFNTGKRSDLTGYQKLLREDIRLKAHMLFDLITYLGEDLNQRRTDTNTSSLGEFIILLGTLGGSVMEMTEIVDMEFAGYFEKAEVKDAEEN